MFERFTDRARRVVVLAQEEARNLQHNYIGTEHLLLGLLGEPTGLAAQALDRFGMSYASVREEVMTRVGTGSDKPGGRIPFTPRAKKVLELGLREALALHHNYIGTEHLLLGIEREREGVAAQILTAHSADYDAVRAVLLVLLRGMPASPGRRWLRRRGAAGADDLGELGEPGEPDKLPTTPAAEAGLAEAARLAGDSPVGSHHLLLATLADPDAAAARTLTALGIDLDQAREALRNADVTDTSDELPADRGRRHMKIRVTDGQVTIDASDPEILRVAHGTLKVLGDQVAEPGTIPGDLPAAASLSTVWQALRDSLEEILRVAMASKTAQEDPATQKAQPTQEAQEAPATQEAQADREDRKNKPATGDH
jgi:Clp amino terminal domain, pathogenicity island component